MCCGTLTVCVFVCVSASVFRSVSAERIPKIDQRTFSVGVAEGVERLRHVIYPRTGRLFHADYERDNAIFRSLERTNFMRRGPFARGLSVTPKRNDGIEEKKHIYVASGRIPGVNTKKGAMAREKDIPLKAVLVKVSNEPARETLVEKRSKRNTEEAVVKEKTEEKIISPDDNGGQVENQSNPNSNLESPSKLNLEKDFESTTKDIISGNGTLYDNFTKKTENKVQEETHPTVKNNDTDKTLFVHDSKQKESEIPTPVRIPGVEVGETLTMKRTVVDDRPSLYPVYRGVKYHYPVLTERRLVYSPQLRVEMDLPVVSEYLPATENNATQTLEEEGRSRRPLKKLAFPLLLALKLKTAIMLPLILGLISLISFKGLWSGLTALGIAAALGLKALVAGSTKVLVQHPIPHPPPHFHHFPPHEITEYWSRRGDEYNDYRPSSWT